jgi:hypothetical protein
VIGHGPSIANSFKGEYIDSFKYVMRFPHRGDWQNPTHYGTRTSFYVGTAKRVHLNFMRKKPEIGFLIWDKLGYKIRETDYIYHLVKLAGGKIVTDFILEQQNKLPYEPKTTCHGTSAILLAIHLLKKPVVAIGHDDLARGTPMHTDYIGTWFYEGTKPQRIEHHFDDELTLIQDYAKECGIGVTFE